MAGKLEGEGPREGLGAWEERVSVSFSVLMLTCPLWAFADEEPLTSGIQA